MMRVTDIDSKLAMVTTGLEVVVAGQCPDWTVEDAINNCREKRWMLLCDDTEDGFLMLSFKETDFSKKQIMTVEAAYHPNANTKMPDFYGVLDFVAQAMGCQEIVMMSNRKGFERSGWTPQWTYYTRPVGGHYANAMG